MGKKEKKALGLAEDFKAMIALVPKLNAFIKIHNEIATGYLKYRKNGGAAISGIEKHLGVKELKSAPIAKKKEPASTKADVKQPKAGSSTDKTKKKS